MWRKTVREKNKGITLIALVLTIIILLILAGIALSQFIGRDGLLSKSRQTRIAQSDAQIMDAMSLTYTQYNMEKALGETDAEFIAYMQDKGFVSADGTVNTVNFIGNKIELGNGTGKKDTYVLEKKDDKYVINYYDEDGEKQKEVWNADSTGDSSTGVTKRDENMFDFDPTTGTILGIKEEYVVDYYNDVIKWCEIEEGIDTLVIPNTINGVEVKEIAELRVRNVKNIVIEEGIQYIGAIGCATDNSRLYGDCANAELEEISIPDSVAYIGKCAFAGCEKLKNINIPSSVTDIGEYAFCECTGLTSIDIPTGVTSIEEDTFYGCTGLTDINIPTDVTSIGRSAFYGCTGLTDINIPTGVTSIEEYTFYWCTGLTNINIPTGVTSIGEMAFYGCTGLTNINIPTGVTSIGEMAFYGCTGLTSINIPSSVTNMWNQVFTGWTSSQTINCQAASKPSGWGSNWKSECNAKVNWGVSM